LEHEKFVEGGSLPSSFYINFWKCYSTFPLFNLFEQAPQLPQVCDGDVNEMLMISASSRFIRCMAADIQLYKTVNHPGRAIWRFPCTIKQSKPILEEEYRILELG